MYSASYFHVFVAFDATFYFTSLSWLDADSSHTFPNSNNPQWQKAKETKGRFTGLSGGYCLLECAKLQFQGVSGPKACPRLPRSQYPPIEFHRY